MSTLESDSRSRILVFLGALAGVAAVAAGAFGAHFLRASLDASGHLDTWRTAVLYNLVHAAVVVAIGNHDNRARQAGWLWLVGILFFSGSLYALSLGGPRWIGPITPLGGVFLILGWIWLGLGQIRRRPGSGEGI